MNKSEAKASKKKKKSVKNILNGSAKPLQEQRLDFNKATEKLALSRTFPPLLDHGALGHAVHTGNCKGLCHTWHR